MLKPLLAVVCLILVASCGPPKTETQAADTLAEEVEDTTLVPAGFREGDYESYTRLENYLPDHDDESNAQWIDSTCAIIITPNETQITHMEEEYGEELATISEDAMFYQAQAMTTLDSLKVRIKRADKNLLKLRGKDQIWTLDVRKEGAPEWNIIFFAVDKKPEIIPAIDVSRETIDEYFNKWPAPRDR
jgi:hypothetical protein